MTKSGSTSAVIELLRERRVATMEAMRKRLDVCHMTVVRALREYGYFTSYNFNSAYYTLADVPVFNRHGLWSYEQVRFSRHGTLADTIVRAVERSSSGMTVRELESRLEVGVRNHLSRLFRAGRLGWRR